MPFTLRPYRRFPVQCAVTYNAGRFLKLPLAYIFGFWFLITLLVLSSGPVYAGWVLTSGDDEAGLTVYVDPDSFAKRGIWRRCGNCTTTRLYKPWRGIRFCLSNDTTNTIVRKREHVCLRIRGTRATWEVVTWFTVPRTSNSGNRSYRVASIKRCGKWRAVRSDPARGHERQSHAS